MTHYTRRSTEPVSIIGRARPVFYREGRRRLCEYGVHKGDQAVTLERLGQERERSSLNSMAGKVLIRIPRHENDAETAPDHGCANCQFMAVDVRELVGACGELKSRWR